MQALTREPLTLIRNNEFYYIEENTVLRDEGAANFSSFRVGNLKGPLDSLSVSSAIFPAESRHGYDVTVSEYNGTSAMVKICFREKSHQDLIAHLRAASATDLESLSQNGIHDWIPTDAVTFHLYYPTAVASSSTASERGEDIQQELKPLLQTFVDQQQNEQQTTDTKDLEIAGDELTSPDFGDVEWLSCKIHELSFLFQSKSDIPLDALEELFHSIFPRRLTSVELVDGVGVVVSTMKDNNRVKVKVFRTLLRKITKLVSDSSLLSLFLQQKMAFDLTMTLIVNLWNLIESFRDIQKACEILKESDKEFREILEANRPHFIANLEHVDSLLGNILTVLANERYDMLPARLDLLVKAVENTMRLVELISVKCSAQLEALEEDTRGLNKRALLHFGLAAFELWYSFSRFKVRTMWQNACNLGVFAANALMLGQTIAAKRKLIEGMKRQETSIKRFHDFHVTLTKIANEGTTLLSYSGDEMTEQRETLIEEFVEFRVEIKQMAEIIQE